MNTLIERYALPKFIVLLFSALLAFQPAAFGQDYARPEFTQRELDQMLAPIALYPDPLLSQILMASTYPLEVVEAARWSRRNPGLRGEGAVRAVAQNDWDPSVKSLVAFPQVLAMMDQKLEWTERLGDAFLAQEPQVMDTVQDLRQRAYVAGNLRSNDQYRVDTRDNYIAIEPASPQFAYVPYYDPRVVYGAWWHTAYPPVYWAAWPGYYPRPGYAGFAWSTGVGISAGFFFGNFDWHQRQARVVNVNNFYYNNRTVIVNREINTTRVTRNVNVAPGAWRHDPEHRRGKPYRVAALNEKFSDARSVERREAPAPQDTRKPAATNGNRPQPGDSASRAPRPEKQSTSNADERRREARDNNRRDAGANASRGETPAAKRPDPQQGTASPDERRRDVSASAGRVEPPASRPNPQSPQAAAEQPRRAPAPPPPAVAPAPQKAAPANPPEQHAARQDRRAPQSGKPHDEGNKSHDDGGKSHDKK